MVTNNSGVYVCSLGDENLYIGSSIDLKTREGNHRNPNFANHADFGKFIHANGLADKFEFKVLENLQHDDREELKKMCRKREFFYKKKLKSRFCLVYDGLCLQSEEVKQQHKQEKREKNRAHRNAQARGYFAKFSREKRDHINKLARAAHARRRLKQDGVNIVRKPRGLTHDQRLERRRERYRLQKLAEGVKIKPRGRTFKPPRKPAV